MDDPKLEPKDDAASEDELLDQVAHEFMKGVEMKDPKMLTEALRALITNIQMQDEAQDHEEND